MQPIWPSCSARAIFAIGICARQSTSVRRSTLDSGMPRSARMSTATCATTIRSTATRWRWRWASPRTIRPVRRWRICAPTCGRRAGTLAADRPYGAWAQDGAIWPAYIYPELEARFGRGDDAGALEVMRRTWGGMLAHDPSSTFWEYAMQDATIHDGSTSLAHGWSTGALPALSTWVLGVRAVRPGYTEYSVAPHAADLAWACGAVPTPQGTLRVALATDRRSLHLADRCPGRDVRAPDHPMAHGG